MDRHTAKSIEMLKRKGLSDREIETELEKSGKKKEEVTHGSRQRAD